MINPRSIPVTLTIAGSDSSAGAGIQADLKSMAAHGCYGICALTSVVSELPGKVSQVQLLPVEMISDQIRVLLSGFPIRAAKTGMLGGPEQVHAVVAAWKAAAVPAPLVVDPVMVATGGGRLLQEDAVDVVRTALLPLAALVTPNMDEASVLWGKDVTCEQSMAQCASELFHCYGVPFLIKGGHLKRKAADVLVDADGLIWLEQPRVADVTTHGTGCSYSAAIAARLAQGDSLRDAVQTAKVWLTRAIRQHLSWSMPDGTRVDALNHLDQGQP